MSRRKRRPFATSVRAGAGFLAGAALWLGAAPAYHRLVAPPAQLLIRAFESPAVTRLNPSGTEVIVDRDDLPESSRRPGVPMSDLDFNVAILTALFAVESRPLGDANLRRFALAAVLLYATHVAALVFKVESLYAIEFGPWSAAHYGAVARNVWADGAHFYRIAGMFAAPFALWWGIGERARPEAETGKGPRRRPVR